MATADLTNPTPKPVAKEDDRTEMLVRRNLPSGFTKDLLVETEQ